MEISINPQIGRWMRKRTLSVCLGLFLGLVAFPHAYANEGVVNNKKPARVVMGWLEFARLEEEKVRFKAKLDTGADNSSVHAKDIEAFTKDEKPWVRFTLINEEGKEFQLEREVVRTVLIRRHGGEPIRRYVVNLKITLGKVSKVVEVNLADRQGFDIPLLIGRSFLAPEILVDSSMNFTVN